MRRLAVVLSLLSLMACGDDAEDAVRDDSGTSSSTMDDTATTIRTCEDTASADEPFNTFMTLIEPRPAVEFEVSVEPSAACPGDTVHFSARVLNHTERDIQVDADVVVTEPLPHVVLAPIEPFTVEARGQATVQQDIVVPRLARGTYDIFVRGWDSSGARLTILRP